MTNTQMEVLEFIKENDVKFVRLAFCDLFGMQKNIAIMAEELERAFTEGVPFDAHLIRGFKDVVDSDLLLFPDPVTLNILPWRPGPGRVVRFYGDIKNPDGSVFSHDGRSILKEIALKTEEMGYTIKVGTECEFYLFRNNDKGEPALNPFDSGGYLDLSPLDKGENIRREICLSLNEMRLEPEFSFHEAGPGQNEIVFKVSDPVEAADNMQTFKTVVKAIAERNGLFASFMPRPLPDKPGNGLHVNLSVNKKGSAGGMEESAGHFIAGILSKVNEITLFLNPTANSFERLGSYTAPKYISWSPHNRSQLVRVCSVNKSTTGERLKIELRSPDSSVNPYLAFALIISAGLLGVENKMELHPSLNADLYNTREELNKNLQRLPSGLMEAAEAARKSDFVSSVLGEELLNKFLEFKEREAREFEASRDKNNFYMTNYFPVL